MCVCVCVVVVLPMNRYKYCLYGIQCYSFLPGRTYCYAKVIQETCSTSAANINVLKSVIYDAQFSGLLRTPCVLGELMYVCYFCDV